MVGGYKYSDLRERGYVSACIIEGSVVCVVIYRLVGGIQSRQDLNWAVAKKEKKAEFSANELEVDQAFLRMNNTLDLPSPLHNIFEELERLDGPVFYLLLNLNFPPTFLHSTPKSLPQIPRSKPQHLPCLPSDARSMHIHELQLLLAFLTGHEARLDPASNVPWDG